ncbi:MAG: hypothetical protein Q8S84_04790 [bacterium]|nr:hypothetical protein [bacterium]
MWYIFLTHPPAGTSLGKGRIYRYCFIVLITLFKSFFISSFVTLNTINHIFINNSSLYLSNS